MSRLLRRGRRRDDGALSVEFALVFPLAVLFIGFIVAIGWYVFYAAVADYVVRDTVRHATIADRNGRYPTQDQLKTYAGNDVGGVLGNPGQLGQQNGHCASAPPPGQQCPLTWTSGDQTSPPPGEGDIVQVTVTYTVPGLDGMAELIKSLPGLGGIDLSPLYTVTRTATARRE